MAEKRVKIDADIEVTTTELASILGVTARRIQQMAQDGTIVPARRGFFQLGDAVQRYINFLCKPQKSAEELKIEKANRRAEASLKASKAQIAKMEMEELRGKMHRSEDVAEITSDLIYTIRSMLVALPGRLAADVTAAETSAEASDIIQKEVYKIMQELSNYRYDSRKYEARVRDRKSWEALNERDDDDG